MSAAVAILFDLDGTLIDSRDDLALAVNLTRQEAGLPPLPVNTISDCVGDGMHRLVARAIPELPEQQAALVDATRRNYQEHLLDHTVLYPGVAEALKRLRALGCPLGVVTNKPHNFTLTILKELGIADSFDAILGGGRSGAQLKPDPAPLLEALRLLGRPAAGAWMVGDHYADLEAGRRAGLLRCLCRYGFGNPGKETWDLAVDQLPEFATHIETLFLQ